MQNYPNSSARRFGTFLCGQFVAEFGLIAVLWSDGFRAGFGRLSALCAWWSPGLTNGLLPLGYFCLLHPAPPCFMCRRCPPAHTHSQPHLPWLDRNVGFRCFNARALAPLASVELIYRVETQTSLVVACCSYIMLVLCGRTVDSANA